MLLRFFPLVRFRPPPTGPTWNLRYRVRRLFSTRPIVLPFIHDCYLQHRVRFYVVRTETCRALLRRAHRHLLCSAIMICLLGHTAVQSFVAEGFWRWRSRRMAQCRWFGEDSGSEIVFKYDVAHVHESLLSFRLQAKTESCSAHWDRFLAVPATEIVEVLVNVPKFVSQDKIQQRTLQSVMRCDTGTRKNLYANVVLSCPKSCLDFS